MKRALLLIPIVLTGCVITRPSQQIANDCIRQRAVAALDALDEVSAISQGKPLPEEYLEPLTRVHDAVSGIEPWSKLVEKDVGEPENPVTAGTPTEIGEQALYAERIEQRDSLRRASPIKLRPNGVPWIDYTAKGGGGLALTIFGVLLKRKLKQISEARRATNEAMEVIASGDAELKRAAASKPALVKAYAEKKKSTYDLRVAELET